MKRSYLIDWVQFSRVKIPLSYVRAYLEAREAQVVLHSLDFLYSCARCKSDCLLDSFKLPWLVIVLTKFWCLHRKRS